MGEQGGNCWGRHGVSVGAGTGRVTGIGDRYRGQGVGGRGGQVGRQVGVETGTGTGEADKWGTGGGGIGQLGGGVWRKCRQ